MIEARGLAPLLQVYDMPTAVRFYRDKLGFEIVTTSPPLGGADRFHWCLLRLGDAELMLNTAYEFDDQRPSREEHNQVRGHYDTCLFISCPDVEGAYNQLLQRGVDLKPPTVAPYGMQQLYLMDPDGFGLCFQWQAD